MLLQLALGSTLFCSLLRIIIKISPLVFAPRCLLLHSQALLLNIGGVLRRGSLRVFRRSLRLFFLSDPCPLFLIFLRLLAAGLLGGLTRGNGGLVLLLVLLLALLLVFLLQPILLNLVQAALLFPFKLYPLNGVLLSLTWLRASFTPGMISEFT